jgi:hypothetical protein
MNTPMTKSSWRQALAARRDARSARRELARQIATFQTPSERLELESILDRHPIEETQEIRRMLVRQGGR